MTTTIDELREQNIDVFINLCDGEPGEDLVGVEVIACLETLNLPFTGCGSKFYETPRKTLKKKYIDLGIGTPAYRFVRSGDEGIRAAQELRFPVIVKPAHGYASIGIVRDSVVSSREALVQRVQQTVATFGEALLEEFIAGREFTVLAAEPLEPGGAPVVYPPMEICFPPNESFKHFELKWRDYASMNTAVIADAALSSRLRRLAADAFVAVAATGYVRFDIRMDEHGELFVLDCNTNPSLFYPPTLFGTADFILASEPNGHRSFLNHIIQSALRRVSLRSGSPQSHVLATT